MLAVATSRYVRFANEFAALLRMDDGIHFRLLPSRCRVYLSGRSCWDSSCCIFQIKDYDNGDDLDVFFTALMLDLRLPFPAPVRDAGLPPESGVQVAPNYR